MKIILFFKLIWNVSIIPSKTEWNWEPITNPSSNPYFEDKTDSLKRVHPPINVSRRPWRPTFLALPHNPVVQEDDFFLVVLNVPCLKQRVLALWPAVLVQSSHLCYCVNSVEKSGMPVAIIVGMHFFHELELLTSMMAFHHWWAISTYLLVKETVLPHLN